MSACTAQRLAGNHRKMRVELLTLHDEQLMDNLIRAYHGLPVLQIRYGIIDGTAKTNAELSGKWSDDDTETINLGGDSGEFTDQTGSGVTGKVAIESTMKISGTPVLDDPELNSAYRAFAKQYLQRSRDRPPHNALLVGSREEPSDQGFSTAHYYWVPAEFEKNVGGTTKMIDLAVKLADLADRVMLDKKKSAGNDLGGSTKVIVAINAHPSQPGTPSVLTYEVTLTPNLSELQMVHGRIELKEPKLRKLAERGVTIKESATVRAVVLPIDGASPHTHLLTVLYAEIEKAAKVGLGQPGGVDPDDAIDWFAKKLTGSMQTLSFEKPQIDGVDLNEVGRLLRAELSK